MKWKALEIEEKPFITFYTVQTYDPKDPFLVDSIDGLYQFGVCTKKIVSGQLVDRTPAEMAVFEAEYENRVFIYDQYKLIDSINSGEFTYDSNTFPMDERSRIFYFAIETSATDEKVMTTTGGSYALTNANIPAFIAAYKTELKNLSKPNLP